jgi:hypothetical protein
LAFDLPARFSLRRGPYQPMEYDSLETLLCPVCNQETGSLKQLRLIRTIIALPVRVFFSVGIVRCCPHCMRRYLWKRCFINGLTTCLIGYVILVPYTLALTIATIPKGHSWPVLRGITPEMQLNRSWEYEASPFERFLALLAVPMCVLPGVGILVCWSILWKLRWCTGWAYKTAEIASFIAYFVTIISVGLSLEHFWKKPH